MANENRTETALATKGTLRWCLEDQESPYMRRLKLLLGDRMPSFNASLINLAHSSGFERVVPQSLITAGIICATLDFPVDRNLGFAWIIPYGELAQFQMGYKGYIQLALRSGRYAGMNAVNVNAEALGEYDSIGDRLIKWDQLDETKPAVGYAFAWRLTTGFTKIVYWPKTKVEAHALRYSRAYQQGKKDSPWFTHFDNMGLKTLITMSLKRWGIMSVEDRNLQLAFERDQSAAIDVDAQPLYPDNNEPATPPAPAADATKPSTLDDLTEHLQQGGPTRDVPLEILKEGENFTAANPEIEVKGSTVEVVAQEFLEQNTPGLHLVPEVEAATEPRMTTEEMPARLQLAQHVSDVRTLEMLWAGPRVKRSDAEKQQIKDMCAARIDEMKASNRKGRATK